MSVTTSIRDRIGTELDTEAAALRSRRGGCLAAVAAVVSVK